jgi:hypothetical protein
MCLALPDICAALESPDGQASGTRYKAWCDIYLMHRLPLLTSDDVYRLRCGVLHQGKFGHPRMQFSRVAFTLPDDRGNQQHLNIVNDVLWLDAITFGVVMYAAYNQWAAAKQNDPNVMRNFPHLVQLRPGGLPPFQGLDCIA